MKSLKASLILLGLAAVTCQAAQRKFSDFPDVTNALGGDLLLIDRSLTSTTYQTVNIQASNFWQGARTNPTFYGKVGIGTNQPQSALHVGGDGKITLHSTNEAGADVTITHQYGAVSIGSSVNVGGTIYVGGANDTMLARASAGNLNVQSNLQVNGGLTVLRDANEFWLGVMPDSQDYAEMADQTAWNNLMLFMTNFLSDKRAIVLHEGDVVANGTNATQWTRAQTQMAKLKTAGLPHLLSMGNHDIDGDSAPARWTTNWNTYFPTNWYKTNSWWYGSFLATTSSENAYLLWTNGTRRYLFMTLECFPRSNTLAWAVAALHTYSNHTAMLVTHAHLHYDNTRLRASDPYGKSSYAWSANANGTDANDCFELLSTNRNLCMILSGHQITNVTARLVSYARGGNRVTQVTANWQWVAPSRVRLMRVRPDQNQVDVFTYDTATSAWIEDGDNRFAFPLHGGSVEQQHIESFSTNVPPRLLLNDRSGSTLRQWSIGPNPTKTDLLIAYGTNQNPENNSAVLRVGTNGLHAGLPLLASEREDGLIFATTFNDSPATQTVDCVSLLRGVWQPNTNTLCGGTTLPSYCTGKSGKGLHFASNYVIYPAQPWLHGLSNLTVSFWFRWDGTNDGPNTIMGIHNSSTLGEWFVTIVTPTWIKFVTINATPTRVELSATVPTITSSTWHHLVGTYDGSAMRFYYDGRYVTNVAQTGVLQSTDLPFYIGCYQGGATTVAPQTWYGDLDNVQIWNRVLSDAQIAKLYGAPWTSLLWGPNGPTLSSTNTSDVLVYDNAGGQGYFRGAFKTPNGISGMTTNLEVRNADDNAHITLFFSGGILTNWNQHTH